jgi:hypothetical protein
MRGASPTLHHCVFLARRKETFTLACGHAVCFRLHYKFPYFVYYYYCWLAAMVAGEFRPFFVAAASSCPVNNFSTVSVV